MLTKQEHKYNYNFVDSKNEAIIENFQNEERSPCWATQTLKTSACSVEDGKK